MPSDITGSVSHTLAGKTIVVAATGSIAAVRAVDLIRDLIRRGAAVHCVMSRAAEQILHHYALEYASSNPVVREITGKVEHVQFCGVGGAAEASSAGAVACAGASPAAKAGVVPSTGTAGSGSPANPGLHSMRHSPNNAMAARSGAPSAKLVRFSRGADHTRGPATGTRPGRPHARRYPLT